MTFNPDADVSGNKARRGGRGAAIAGGGVVGIGGIIALVLALLTGGSFDINSLLSGGEGQAGDSSASTSLADCKTGADANKQDSCRIAAGSLAINQFWKSKARGYREPTLTVVDGSTSTPCGTASNAVGPFYCPRDEGVYVDPTFFGLMRKQFGATAGNLAQLYVLAHEYGHHVQNITGTMAKHPNKGTGASSNSVRTELQADCYAGAWVGEMTEAKDDNGVPYLQAPTKTQIKDALNAAAAVGDDHIQSRSGRVSPESFTHGTSAQRQRWFSTGYQGGVGKCDTFSVSGRRL